VFYRDLPLNDFIAFEESVGAIIGGYGPENVLVADNLITLDRSLGFARDAKFMAAFRAEAGTPPGRSVIWRLHVLCWAARHAAALEGDFVECGVYEGLSSAVVARYLDFGTLAKRLWLYDLFDHSERTSGSLMPAHGPGLAARVARRFSSFPNVRVIPGLVPEVLDHRAPEKIAWFHLDLNSAEAERGALDRLFDRITPGGLLIFDDYGWKSYGDQKGSADRFAASRDHSILELPTGQGLLIKR